MMATGDELIGAESATPARSIGAGSAEHSGAQVLRPARPASRVFEADQVAPSGPVASGSFVQALMLTGLTTGSAACAPVAAPQHGVLIDVLGEMGTLLRFPLWGPFTYGVRPGRPNRPRIATNSVTNGSLSISTELALNITDICNKGRHPEEFGTMTPDRPARLRRRAVLASAVAGVGFAIAGSRRCAEPVSAALHRLFGDHAGLQEFGRIFHARQANAAAHLLACLDGVEGNAVRSRLDALRKEDFAAGRVVVINGWVLARTEAEACAFITVT